MNIKRHIPNFLTCCNLLCGCLGIIICFKIANSPNDLYEDLTLSSFLIFIACIFDFLDGFVARILKVTSSIGKELDSLADVVTFGVLPSLIIFQLINKDLMLQTHSSPFIPIYIGEVVYRNSTPILSCSALILAIFSALRLAKFNIDERQSEGFIGVPTPANAILIASFPLILSINQFTWLNEIISNHIFLIAFSIIMSYLLVAELPLFALKFKDFKWKNNQIRFSFLAISALLLMFLWWTAIPIIIFLYVGLSFAENKIFKPKVS
jgi:CDP-diacylglycerol--serine O-phosphatidyltransferase